MSEIALTPEDVAEIVAILDGSDYSELDIATTRFRLRVRREGTGAGWTQEWQWSATTAAAPAEAAETADTSVPEGLVGVAAPLPGTFYRAPAPGAAPFVEVGAHVTPDTVVGIVETMKLMNPVAAGVAGEVVAIPVANATLVDKGAPLVHIRPA